jgi:hypothetical protein
LIEINLRGGIVSGIIEFLVDGTTPAAHVVSAAWLYSFVRFFVHQSKTFWFQVEDAFVGSSLAIHLYMELANCFFVSKPFVFLI